MKLIWSHSVLQRRSTAIFLKFLRGGTPAPISTFNEVQHLLSERRITPDSGGDGQPLQTSINCNLLFAAMDNLHRIFKGWNRRTSLNEERESYSPEQVTGHFSAASSDTEVGAKRKTQKSGSSSACSVAPSHEAEDNCDIPSRPRTVGERGLHQETSEYCQEKERDEVEFLREEECLRICRKQIPQYDPDLAAQQSANGVAAAARNAVIAEPYEIRQRQASYEHRNSELEGEVRELKETLKATRDEATRAQSSYADLGREHQILSQEMASQRMQQSTLEQQISEAKSQFQDVKDRLMVLQGARRDSLLPMNIRDVGLLFPCCILQLWTHTNQDTGVLRSPGSSRHVGVQLGGHSDRRSKPKTQICSRVVPERPNIYL